MGVDPGCSFGVTFVISMWHWKRRWHKLMALAPYSVALVTWLGWYPPNVRDAMVLAASMVFFISFAVFGAWVAVYTARPIARALCGRFLLRALDLWYF